MNKKVFRDKAGNNNVIGQVFATNHRQWIDNFSGIAFVIDQLHQPTESISRLIAHLDAQKQVIKRQLLARLVLT